MDLLLVVGRWLRLLRFEMLVAFMCRDVLIARVTRS